MSRVERSLRTAQILNAAILQTHSANHLWPPTIQRLELYRSRRQRRAFLLGVEEPFFVLITSPRLSHFACPLISFRPIPLLPLRLKWDGYIAEFRWNDFFCDEQRRGPFRYIHHCHRVRGEIREGASGAVVSDVLEYELPMGPLGDLLNRLAMKRQLRAFFAYRQRMLPLLLSQSPLGIPPCHGPWVPHWSLQGTKREGSASGRRVACGPCAADKAPVFPAPLRH
jgi:hypothetical protein